ncbi:aminopeptidase [Alkalihalobacillus sp. TS-13]|uniref:aminopeptidase n=1 Tax=Alkalihalobacillus sp. TS-13 TaxID=2842455 RepID=UPI001C8759A8|nr:aminopeptidase [Alkalihalobacillus sp. TS-13]
MSRTYETKLVNLAEVTLNIGLNLQKNQILHINADLDAAPFVRKVTEAAYKKGARHVYINWIDQETSKLKILYALEESLTEFPEWSTKRSEELIRQNAAFLSIRSPQPDAFSGLDPDRVGAVLKASALEMKQIASARKAGIIAFCIVCVPNEKWAGKVYPDHGPEEAQDMLWKAVFDMTRVDCDDPIEQWQRHIGSLLSKVDELNTMRFQKLHLEAPGTDLIVELPDRHLWVGGGATTQEGLFFTPNLPTEEVFTAPKRDGVNGTVRSTMPLVYGSTAIEDITLTFKDGKIIKMNASKGLETLKRLIDSDEGSHYLGEIALVPEDSPIAEENTIFYNTLFDENSSCHLAIGAAYPLCVEDGTNMTSEELSHAGLNMSITHVDFMIGSPKMNIDGIHWDGRREPVFQNGCWVKKQ